MIRFGAMSIVLLLGASYGCLFALLLWFSRRNRLANRFLAVLLLVIALQLLPYIIGYAGFYDAFPWLSYLPYEASLAFGPLLWLYLRVLTTAARPRRWLWHFLPVVVQLLYYAAIFPMPLAFKNEWNATIHVPKVLPFEQLATFASIGIYWWLSLRHVQRYQSWLPAHVSDRDEHRMGWLRGFLIALGITLLFWAGLAALQRWVVALNYFQEFPFYLWFAVLSYFLGTEGYRHAAHRYPAGTGGEPATSTGAMAGSPPVAMPSMRDWRERGRGWRQQVLDAEWWRDPQLSLAGLARHLGTNTSELSRAINDGLGENFNSLINGMRVEEVKRVLIAGGSSSTLLDIALDAGFASKASFNRCFKAIAGETPSAFAARAPPSMPAPASQIVKTAGESVV
ncbi:MAG: helix-turn-helix domain-containing protein [Dokdonella sp.]